MIKNKRQARYRTTDKGRTAHIRGQLKYIEELKKTISGRIKIRYGKILSEWGRTVADWWINQKCKCEICKKQFYEKAPLREKKNTPDWNREMVIDHDHNYKKRDFKNNSELLPRGMLCNRCNLILGFAKDDVQRLQSCINYLNGKNMVINNDVKCSRVA
jgi:hypothetical protein